MSGVIVDTSVWIDALRGTLAKSNQRVFENLLETDQAYLTDVIRHEILVGTRDENQYKKLDRLLWALPSVGVAVELFPLLNRFGFRLKKAGLLGSFTDVSIAFLASEQDFPVYSFDLYFQKLARKGWIKTLNLDS